jgi:hypothetical protein
MLVVRGTGHDSVTDGAMYNGVFISSRECPQCGWLTRPFSRCFATEVIGADPCEDMREWDLREQEDMDEVRGGGGDVLSYDTLTDVFKFALGSGVGPECVVSNPCPGRPLDGARLVWRFADICWEN